MFLAMFLAHWRKLGSASNRAITGRPSRRFLQVELLEDRTLPSSITAGAMADLANSNYAIPNKAAIGSLVASIDYRNVDRLPTGVPPSPGFPAGVEVPESDRLPSGVPPSPGFPAGVEVPERTAPATSPSREDGIRQPPPGRFRRRAISQCDVRFGNHGRIPHPIAKRMCQTLGKRPRSGRTPTTMASSW